MEKELEKKVIKDLKLDGYFSEEFQEKIIALDIDPELLKKKYAWMEPKHDKEDYKNIPKMTVQDIH